MKSEAEREQIAKERERYIVHTNEFDWEVVVKNVPEKGRKEHITENK